MAKQIETATVTAVGGIVLAGNAKVTITSALVGTVVASVAVLNGDSSADVAAKIRTALAINASVAPYYLISGGTDKVILTAHLAAANDTSLNIAVDNDTCTGLTAAPTSADSVAGSGLTNAYATLAEFKAYMTTRGGSSSTDANDDTVMEDVLEDASRYLDGQTGRRFYADSADVTRYYTPLAQDRIYIDDLSAAPTSIKCDYTADRSYSKTLSSSDYDLEPDNASAVGWPYTYVEMAPHASEYFPTIRKGVQIVAKFGWPSVPDDIKSACLGIALNVYQSRTGQSSAGNITVTASGVVIRPQDVPAIAQKTIEKYRRLF
jgi:hypothetical protein